jgi:carboxylesterase type B
MLIILPCIISVIIIGINSEFVEDRTLVRISNGVLRGRRLRTDRGSTGFAYLNIPYALPPTGVRRYRPSELNTVPFGVMELNATEYGPACMSNSSRPHFSMRTSGFFRWLYFC